MRDLICIGYQVFKGNKIPMNAAISQVLKGGISGSTKKDYQINFSGVVLSRGELLASVVREISMVGDGMLSTSVYLGEIS